MEERKLILKMIEDGKISAEEGVKLLEALHQENQNKQEAEAKQPDSTEISTNVDWKTGNDYRKTYRQPSGTGRFSEFIENTLQKIKDFDLDFNFGSFVHVDHIFQHRQFTPTMIDVSLENGSITLEPWDELDVRVECKGKVYRVKDQAEAKRTFLREVTFEPDAVSGTLTLSTTSRSIKVNTVLYIPREMYERVKLYTFNGHIKTEKVTGAQLVVKVVNGSIGLDQLTAETLLAETVNGAIVLTNTKLEKCQAKTMNGAIDVVGSVTEADLETVNGAVTYELEQVSESGRIDVKATTGSVRLTLPVEVRTEGKLRTNVGGFSCDLPKLEIIAEKKELAQKTLAFVANKDQTPRVRVEAETKTGSIKLTSR